MIQLCLLLLFQSPTTSAYDYTIIPLARHAHVPVSLVKGVITVESDWDPLAQRLDGPDGRRGGSYGLMQVSFQTAREMGYRGEPWGLLNADTNLAYGIRYLGWMYQGAGGDAARAVSAYNGAPTKANQAYTAAVLAAAETFIRRPHALERSKVGSTYTHSHGDST